jgi:hypothetical protein
VTRPAQRILERARASAWRRVGIPARWSVPAPARDEETTPGAADADAGAPAGSDAGAASDGKNVAAEGGEDAGTGRRDTGVKPVSHDSTEP